MKIINGKKIAAQILADLKKEIKKKKLKPSLAVILVGDNPVSLLYVQKKEQAAQRIGVEIKKYLLSEKTSEKEILNLIDSLNQDKQINGILVQMPLSESIDSDKVIKAIDPSKDVDGFLLESKFDQPFIMAIQKALEATGPDWKSKKSIALVNSDVFGRVLESKLHIKYQTRINDLDGFDVIITALGQSNCIKNDMIKEGVILIDGGISKVDGKTVGDIDRESVKEKAKWLAPVPGGLGLITVAFLLKNVVLAAKK